MIKYKFDEENQYIQYYANKLNDEKVLKILEAEEVKNADEATYLTEFFWRMVDASIEDEKSGVELPWVEGSEFWNEKLMYSISGYLERAGYELQWEEESDRHNPE